MSSVTAAHLKAIMGGNPVEWVEPINTAIEEFGVRDIAAFLAHCGHESQRLTRVAENLNYGAPGLLATFPKYFNEKQADQYARRPEAIANRVYANRMGNGDEASGDGWRYRGKGLIQVTGKDNHRACGEALRQDLVAGPDLLLAPVFAARSAGWYWAWRKLDGLDLRTSTLRINGGMKGYADRELLFTLAVKVLAS